MRKHLLITALLISMAGIASAGNMILLEEGIEFDALSLRVSDKNIGDFRIRPCDGCEAIQLKIKPTTKLEVGGKHVSLSVLNKSTLRGGTVFYRESDNVVTRIEATR